VRARHWLLDRLEANGDLPALICDDDVLSHAAFAQAIETWSEQLFELDIPPGSTVAVSGDFAAGPCALLFALCVSGHVAVPLTSGDPAERARLETSGAQALLRFEHGKFVGIERLAARPRHLLIEQLHDRQHAGLVLFSSGSSGCAKAVLLDFDRVLERMQARRSAYRSLSFLLFDHIGGINTLAHALSQGGTVIPLRARDPATVCRTIERHRVELLPTTPTFLNMLLISGAIGRHDLGSLRLITYGTEPMPQATLSALAAALPDVRIKQTYGLSELGILPTRSRASDSLWLELGGEGLESKVVDGTLRIRARGAMLGYLNAPSPFDDEGWLDTGDEVEVDGEYVRILGRRSDVINVGGEKVHATEVESVLLQIDNIADAVVHARHNPVTGQVVTATVTLRVPEDRRELQRRVRRFCRERLRPHQIPATLEIAEGGLHGQRFKRVRATL
jgi:long-chain acyl-CoA synthetase